MIGNVSKSKNMTLGETPSTAYPGDRGKAVTEDLKAHKEKSVASETGVHNIRLFENSLQFFNGEDWEPAQSGGLTPQIIVSALTGSTVKCTSADGKTVLTATCEDGTCTIDVPDYGEWSLQASLNANNSNTEIIVVDQVKQYRVYLDIPKVFGVMWDYGNSSTALSRLTPYNDIDEFVYDINGFVTVHADTEPVPAVNTGTGSSPFDEYSPWKDMTEYNVIENDGIYTAAYKRGDSGFTRTRYDTMIYIPKFYYKIIDDAQNRRRFFYISEKVKEGFELHPGSGRFVARYNSYHTKSTSGIDILLSVSGRTNTDSTRATVRSKARNKGNGWYLYDYASWCAVWLLYLVEFADWDSQKTIGRGYVDMKASTTNIDIYEAVTGVTDSMMYHTGRISGTVPYHTGVQYRNIENPWGAMWEWIDGINFIWDSNINYSRPYICTDLDSFIDDTTEGCVDVGVSLLGHGTLSTSGYTGTLMFSEKFPWVFIPGSINGSDATYIPDRTETNSGNHPLIVGGCLTDYSDAGLFKFCAAINSNSMSRTIGSRLMFIPQDEEELS